MYVPHIGTFIQRDPLPQGAQVLGYTDAMVAALRSRMSRQESSNLYSYCIANPTNRRDPQGLICAVPCSEVFIRCLGLCEAEYENCLDASAAAGLGLAAQIGCSFGNTMCCAACSEAYIACTALEAFWASIDVALLVVGAVLVIGGIAYTVVTLPAGAGGGLGLAALAAGVLVIAFVLSDDHEGHCCLA
jgi:hypothetical protein